MRYANLETLSHAAAEQIVTAASDAIAERGAFHIALSGGSTPRRLYQLLATDYAARVDWEQVWVWWSDERCVPPDSDESCYRMAKDTLLDFVPVPAAQIMRMEGERDPAIAAQDYETILIRHLGAVPALDLSLLGMGSDGHTASLFPDTSALTERSRWIIENFVPKLSMWRLTMTYRTINHARQVLVMASGAEKVMRYNQAQQPGCTLPIARVQPSPGWLVWMIGEQ